MACEYCVGRVHTRKPFRVFTQSGASLDVIFDFCPCCGRKIKPNNPVQMAHLRLVQIVHNDQATYGQLTDAIEEAIGYLNEALNAKGDQHVDKR